MKPSERLTPLFVLGILESPASAVASHFRPGSSVGILTAAITDLSEAHRISVLPKRTLRDSLSSATDGALAVQSITALDWRQESA